MTTTSIILICSLLLLAYLFDLSAAVTKVPSVILLLLLGWLVKQACNYFEVQIPSLQALLPILGTIGLILIVLEGSLELELNKARLPMVGKTALMAFIPLLVVSLIGAFMLGKYGGVSFKIALVNTIPFAIISSAIAIPSAQSASSSTKEFITYESSLSDIFGVIFFNFIALNEEIGAGSFAHFLVELLLTLLLTAAATLLMAFLLSKIKHHVKYVPIILMTILIYALAKMYHLPALILILLFGLFLGNLDELKHVRLVQKLQPTLLNTEVHKFKELTTEIAFLIRALFFLLFGFLIQTEELLNTETIGWALALVGIIFATRWLCLWAFKVPILPVLFIAPRGLITILLFLSIPVAQQMNLVNKSLIIQVIILSACIMMVGLMVFRQRR